MRQMDLTVEVCGSSGDGTLAAGGILTTTLAYMGYHVLSFDVYPAEIRGFGKCVAHSRVSDEPVNSVGREVDILVSLNDPYSIEQLPTLKSEGVVIFDSWPLKEIEESDCIAGHLRPGQYLYGVPLRELSQRATHSSRSRNIVALGALAGLFQIEVEPFVERLRFKFRKKGRVADDAEAAFRAGVDYTRGNIYKLDPYSFKMEDGEGREHFVVMTGNDAAAKGAIDAGCKFYAGYPITPATKIMEILSEKLPAEGGTVVQSEDEIAAIGMVTGASLVGVRAMTATSGPGLCLMTEFIGYNIMTENPVVIIDSQRGGPATGLPTKTEQSDLMMALFTGNGDAPRIVLAPTNVQECHYWVAEAFYLAEKYQTPVIVLMDLFLSTCKQNAVLKTIDKKKLNANKTPTKAQMKNYRRQLITDDGISPRTVPGTPGGEWVVSGLEQNQSGDPAYDAATHTAMSEKRFRKMRRVFEHDTPAPERFGKKGKVKLGVIGWGSTTGAVIEAVQRANDEGLAVAALKQVVLNPLRVEEIEAFCEDCEEILIPELNYAGQFAFWISVYMGRRVHRFARATGRPINYLDVLEEIRKYVGEKS